MMRAGYCKPCKLVCEWFRGPELGHAACIACGGPLTRVGRRCDASRVTVKGAVMTRWAGYQQLRAQLADLF